MTTPVTVLTGFLGAGKTTLLNHLLRQPELAKAAVLMNEFGEIGVDHLLVEKISDTTVTLSTGCLCCTVRGDLAKALREMLPKARRGDISRVVVETTGLADPIPILATLMTDPVAAAAYRLDGIVTVVDAVNGVAHLDAHDEAVRQVAVADRIVVSKTDLADPAPLCERLRRINPGAPLLRAGHGAVDPAFVLNAGLFEPGTKAPDVSLWLNADAFQSTETHRHHHDPNRHDANIAAFCLTLQEPLDWLGLSKWLEMFIASSGEHLLRMKGILSLQGHDRPVAVHAIRHLMHPPVELPAWPEGDQRASRMVFIVRNLSRTVIEKGLRASQSGQLRQVP